MYRLWPQAPRERHRRTHPTPRAEAFRQLFIAGNFHFFHARKEAKRFADGGGVVVVLHHAVGYHQIADMDAGPMPPATPILITQVG